MMTNFARATAFLSLLTLPALAQAASDIDTLATQIYTDLLETPKDDAIPPILAALNPDGSFSDVDYTDANRANWKTQRHLNHLQDLLFAYADPASKYHQDDKVKQAALAAYAHWVTHDYQNPNWYFNLISTPQKLATARLIMQQNGFLPEANFAAATKVVDHALKGQGGASQGANLASQARITVIDGVVRYRHASPNSPEQHAAEALIKKSYAYIGSTLSIVPNLEDDGIRPDYSFQQHQQTIYDGGYGAGLVSNVASSANWAVGTGFGLPSSDIRHMVDYLLNGGPSWMFCGTAYDPLVTGRYWSRPKVVDAAANLLAPVRTALALSKGYHEPELQSLLARLEDATKTGLPNPSLAPTGNRHYPISDYTVHHRPGFMLSLRTTSSRTNSAESINGENLKAGYATAGITLLLLTGHEYDNIYPVWDWTRLPGTTSERPAPGSPGYDLKPDHHLGKSAAVGAVSNGLLGAAIYPLSEYNITANKADFFFNRGLLAAANSISQSKPNSPTSTLGTNLNQTLLDGPVTYSTAENQSAILPPNSTLTPPHLRWVHHHNTAYLFLTPVDNAAISTLTQTGSWRSISTSGSPEQVSIPVFSLDLTHSPTSNTYLYAIVPNLTPEEIDPYLATHPFTLLRNDQETVAARDNATATTAIHFLKPTTLTLPDRSTFTNPNAHPSSLLVTLKDNTLTLSFANIDTHPAPFTFTTSLPLTGPDATYNPATHQTTLTLHPIEGPLAGSTLTQTYTLFP